MQEKERREREKERREREKERREREKRKAEEKEKSRKAEKQKQEKERKEVERQERERKERERKEREKKEKERKEKERKQWTRSGSQSRRRNISQTSNEAQLPQGRHTPSEGSQGSQVFTNPLDSTLEEGAKQMSSEAQGDDLQMATADDSLEPDPEQLIAIKSQQEAKDKRIAELEQELEQTKSARKQMLQGEIALLEEKEAVMKAQYQQNMSDFEEVLQRKHAEVERLSNIHATEMQAMQDDHSKKISQLRQEKQQSENEKDEEARKLQEELHEVRREIVQFKERADLLETKLKEKEVEQEVCALPPDHHVEEMRKVKEELHNTYEQEINQLTVAFEKREAESKEEIDRLRQEQKATDEKHAEDVKQLCESRQENEQEANRIHQELQEANEKLTNDLQNLHEMKEESAQEADRLRQELKDVNERHTDEVRQLQLKNKDEQELHLELEEAKAKNAEEIQQLKSELKQKDEQHAKAIVDMKAEYEDKKKKEEHQKDSEVKQKIKRQDVVASGVLRDMKNEVEKLKKECETKDAAIVQATEELEKMKKVCQQKDLEIDKYIEATKMDSEKSQHEQRRQYLAEASKKHKEHDQQLEIKKREIDYLKKQLQKASDKLMEEKGEPETVQRLKEQLQEKDDELKTVVAEIQTLLDSYRKLTAENEHLQHVHEQLRVEVKMKRELAESSECFSCDDPSDTTVSEPQLQGQLVSDTGTTDEERDFQSASESSFTEQEEDANLTDMEKMQLLQKVATAEKDAKHAREALQKMSNENETLRVKLDTVNKQVQKLEEWHRLLVENTEQASSSEVTAHESQEKVIIDREKFVKLKRNFIHLTERYMKIEKSHQELLEKIEERDKQIKELQLKVRDDSAVPKVRVYESLSSGEGAESVEELSHDTALREIKKQKAVIFQLRNRVASLQAQISAFEKTAAEHSKMEQHGKEQSKAVMEWRQKFEVAENKLKEQEDELHILKGEVSAKRGLPKDFVDVQQLEADYEGRIEALNTAMNTLEVDKAELTTKWATKGLVCEQLEQENKTLQQTLKELDGKHSQLKCLYDSVTQQLSQLNEYRGEVDAMKKLAAVIHKAITAKTVEAKDLKEEKESLQKILEDIAEELVKRKIKAQTYKEDFEKERTDRTELAAKYDSEKVKMSVEHQTVVDKYREKEALLEKALAHKSDLEKQLKKSRKYLEHQVNQLQLQLQQLSEQQLAERTELQQQVAKAKAQCHNSECIQLKKVFKEERDFLIAKLNHQQGTITAMGARMNEIKRALEKKVTLLYRRMKDSNCLLQQQLQWINQQMKRFVAKVDGKLTPFNIGPLQLLQHVGQGSYGCVYTAKVEGTTCIAKRLHDILVSFGREDRKQYDASVGRFQQECLLLSRVRHPNIVQFMGVHYTEQDSCNMTLLMERLPVDLGQCIGKCHTENYELALGIKISILVDICNGLSYLHSEDKSKKSIIHRDLSASNILLTPDMQAKIADLGVSKILSNHSRWSQQLSKAPGAHGYMPPEALKDPPDYDCKLDVFSFGVIALYVAVQEYPEFSWEQVPEHIFKKGEGEQWKRQRWISKMGDKHPLASVICKCLLIKEKRPNTEHASI